LEFGACSPENVQGFEHAREIRCSAGFPRLAEAFEGAAEGFRVGAWGGVFHGSGTVSDGASRLGAGLHQVSFSTEPEARAWETNAWLSWTESTWY
jgi:hypothetical protein